MPTSLLPGGPGTGGGLSQGQVDDRVQAGIADLEELVSGEQADLNAVEASLDSLRDAVHADTHPDPIIPGYSDQHQQVDYTIPAGTWNLSGVIRVTIDEFVVAVNDYPWELQITGAVARTYNGTIHPPGRGPTYADVVIDEDVALSADTNLQVRVSTTAVDPARLSLDDSSPISIVSQKVVPTLLSELTDTPSRAQIIESAGQALVAQAAGTIGFAVLGGLVNQHRTVDVPGAATVSLGTLAQTHRALIDVTGSGAGGLFLPTAAVNVAKPGWYCILRRGSAVADKDVSDSSANAIQAGSSRTIPSGGALLLVCTANGVIRSVTIPPLPTQANLYDFVKAMLVHNSAVTADDGDHQLDIAASGGGTGQPFDSNRSVALPATGDSLAIGTADETSGTLVDITGDGEGTLTLPTAAVPEGWFTILRRTGLTAVELGNSANNTLQAGEEATVPAGGYLIVVRTDAANNLRTMQIGAGSVPTAETVRNLLQTLENDDRLDATHIKGLEGAGITLGDKFAIATIPATGNFPNNVEVEVSWEVLSAALAGTTKGTIAARDQRLYFPPNPNADGIVAIARTNDDDATELSRVVIPSGLQAHFNLLGTAGTTNSIRCHQFITNEQEPAGVDNTLRFFGNGAGMPATKVHFYYARFGGGAGAEPPTQYWIGLRNTKRFMDEAEIDATAVFSRITGVNRIRVRFKTAAASVESYPEDSSSVGLTWLNTDILKANIDLHTGETVANVPNDHAFSLSAGRYDILLELRGQNISNVPVDFAEVLAGTDDRIYDLDYPIQTDAAPFRVHLRDVIVSDGSTREFYALIRGITFNARMSAVLRIIKKA